MEWTLAERSAERFGASPGLDASLVADLAALHGVLDQIEALGLELLEVRQLPG